jgi:hypothetical protein
MTCGSCVRTIEEGISERPAVVAVSVSLEEGTATIRCVRCVWVWVWVGVLCPALPLPLPLRMALPTVGIRCCSSASSCSARRITSIVTA